MPVQYLDAPSIPLSYEELTSWAEAEASSQGVNINQYLATINERYPDADLTDFMIDESKKYLDFYQNEDGTYTVIGAYRDYQSTNYTNPIDSNSSQISRGSFRQAINNGVENVGGVIKRHMTTFPSSGSLGQQASYVIGSVGGAVAAASSGITLGKIISPVLYDVAPNFWNSIGVSEGSFDPANWASLTNGSDSPFAGLLNFILGIDPETGKSQAYMDENALAYMAYAMAQAGVFNTEGEVTGEIGETSKINIEDYGHVFCNTSGSTVTYPPTGDLARARYTITYTIVSGNARFSSYPPVMACASLEPFTFERTEYHNNTLYSRDTYQAMSSNVRGVRIYGNYDTFLYPAKSQASPSSTWSGNRPDFMLALASGTYSGGGQEGINDDPDATQPDVSDWSDIPSTLQSLQNQYPDIFGNPLVWDNIQPDGTQTQARYVPVAMPNFTYNNDQQPISANSTQTNPQLDSNTSTDTLLKAITDAIQATQTQTQPSTQIPPQNPVTTGTGEPPALVPPSGSASALWSVYHPTQAQVNSFGAWLWSDNIITQIQQLLQNPMEGIITLHKVFAPPVDSGQGTIVVGRLDSKVSSATVNQQYVTVDCGEIDCAEQFGNVFDYSPFTSISIYLPFIGIAPLGVDDIMRSKIHVTYGVDVFTGVCLAMIEVSRDGSTVNMYQYAGVASVEYPLTGTVHNGLITGIMGIVGGFATIASAGATAPIASIGGVTAAAGGAVTTGRQAQSRSGNFSGNAGAMGIKTPYLIIERPQTKVAHTFPELAGYPTNKSLVLRECSGHVVVKHVHVEGINATQSELIEIENLLQSGVLV